MKRKMKIVVLTFILVPLFQFIYAQPICNIIGFEDERFYNYSNLYENEFCSNLIDLYEYNTEDKILSPYPTITKYIDFGGVNGQFYKPFSFLQEIYSSGWGTNPEGFAGIDFWTLENIIKHKIDSVIVRYKNGSELACAVSFNYNGYVTMTSKEIYGKFISPMKLSYNFDNDNKLISIDINKIARSLKKYDKYYVDYNYDKMKSKSVIFGRYKKEKKIPLQDISISYGDTLYAVSSSKEKIAKMKISHDINNTNIDAAFEVTKSSIINSDNPFLNGSFLLSSYGSIYWSGLNNEKNIDFNINYSKTNEGVMVNDYKMTVSRKNIYSDIKKFQKYGYLIFRDFVYMGYLANFKYSANYDENNLFINDTGSIFFNGRVKWDYSYITNTSTVGNETKIKREYFGDMSYDQNLLIKTRQINTLNDSLYVVTDYPISQYPNHKRYFNKSNVMVKKDISYIDSVETVFDIKRQGEINNTKPQKVSLQTTIELFNKKHEDLIMKVYTRK